MTQTESNTISHYNLDNESTHNQRQDPIDQQIPEPNQSNENTPRITIQQLIPQYDTNPYKHNEA
jgi:hypothetical protein